MPFGQLIIGPPGSGKSTFCQRYKQLYNSISRPAIIVNLDPANEIYTDFDIDISEIITLLQVMQEFDLGPNAGLIYCMEYLEKNLDWLWSRLESFKDHYILIDCPGQVELFTHHPSLKNIIDQFQKKDFRLCALHLIDSFHCVDASRYVSMILLSLQAMLQIELPFIHVLSKMDLIKSMGNPVFNLEFYTQVQDLEYLMHYLSQDSTIPSRYTALTKAIAEVVQDFGLVSFEPLAIDDPESVIRLARLIDKANGYVFGGLENGSIFDVAIKSDGFVQDVYDLHEKFIGNENCSE